jgi:outer membrane protein OmpA-like peptidoglycan-associated protein
MKLYTCLLTSLPLFGFTQTDTLAVYFDIGKFEINSTDLEKLKAEKKNWQKVDIVSYTDYLGSQEMNNNLSMRRSREVRARLVQYGLDTEILGVVKGLGVLGETLKHSEGIRESRRADVIIYKSVKINGRVEVEEYPIVGTKKIKLQDALADAKVGDHLVLSEMIFLPGQHFLTEESTVAYNELFQVLKNNPNLKIKIEGHICCKLDNEDGLDLATSKYNLSEARAEYVYEMLLEDGIEESRLSFEGFAREKPLYPDEKTGMEKQLNRRVEIRIENI